MRVNQKAKANRETSLFKNFIDAVDSDGVSDYAVEII